METPEKKFPKIIEESLDSKTWDEWLEKTESQLKSLGYRRFIQNFKNEDFAYWKTFYTGEEKAYQVGLMFYDLRKYANETFSERIGVQFECLLLEIDGRIDLSVSKDIALNSFEIMAETHYNTMIEFASL